MRQADFRFYAELNDFLPPQRRFCRFTHPFLTPGSIKDLIEGLGVPHTEIDLILVDGASVAFEHRMSGGEDVSVYPVFEALDISPLLRLRPEPLREPRFVLDVHLGRLASLLRLLGFDTLYDNHCDDPELAARSASQRRILLTRDRGLLKRSEVTHGYCVRESQPRRQAAEVVHRFDLQRRIRLFTRCPRCNGGLQTRLRESVARRLPPRVRELSGPVQECLDCGKLYWEGTHTRSIRDWVQRVLGMPPDSAW